MKRLILSRGPTIDIQKVTKIVGGNKFNLVLIAAQRARDLRRQNPNTYGGNTVEALLDIQAEAVKAEELLEKRASYKPKAPKRVDTGPKRK